MMTDDEQGDVYSMTWGLLNSRGIVLCSMLGHIVPLLAAFCYYSLNVHPKGPNMLENPLTGPSRIERHINCSILVYSWCVTIAVYHVKRLSG